ncbi:MAG: hypothetical protein ABFS08_11705 [Pseudomonadota bacterium]
MAGMLVAANIELRELAKLIEIPGDLYEEAGLLIDGMAEDHSHMKVSEFVDLCLNLARIQK